MTKTRGKSKGSAKARDESEPLRLRKETLKDLAPKEGKTRNVRGGGKLHTFPYEAACNPPF